MIKPSTTVIMDWGAIRRLTGAQVVALQQTADALKTEVKNAQVIPRDTGHLQGDAFYVDDELASRGRVTLTHSTPYARRLYFHPEYHFSKVANPNAKGAWFEDWITGNKRNWARETFKKLYKEETGV